MSIVNQTRCFVERLINSSIRDKAVFYTLLSRVTSICLGPLVVVAVGTLLSPEELGVYYVFGSLLMLRGLIDLGFSQSTQQLLANRFADLKFCRESGVTGNEVSMTQFLNLAKFSCIMYQIMGYATLLLIGISGHVFLSGELSAHENVDWVLPWWVVILSVSIGIWNLGIVVVADGANQVALTNKFRFWTELAAILAFLITLAVGGGLWALAFMALVRILLPYPIAYKLGSRIKEQIRTADSSSIEFRRVIWPLQSRNIVVYGLGFFYYYSYSPITLYFLGPATAGKMGMALQIANMVSSFALVWFNTKLPLMGNLAGSNNYAEVLRLNKSGLRISLGMWVIFSVFVIGILIMIVPYIPQLNQKIAPMGTVALFIVGAGAFIWHHIRATFIRAFCHEVFAPLAVIQALLTPTLLWLTLPLIGIQGTAITYVAMMLLSAFWAEASFRSFRKRSCGSDALAV